MTHLALICNNNIKEEENVLTHVDRIISNRRDVSDGALALWR